MYGVWQCEERNAFVDGWRGAFPGNFKTRTGARGEFFWYSSRLSGRNEWAVSRTRTEGFCEARWGCRCNEIFPAQCGGDRERSQRKRAYFRAAGPESYESWHGLYWSLHLPHVGLPHADWGSDGNAEYRGYFRKSTCDRYFQLLCMAARKSKLYCG